MVDKSEPVGVGVVASLLGLDNSLADRLVRRLACTSEDMGEGGGGGSRGGGGMAGPGS